LINKKFKKQKNEIFDPFFKKKSSEKCFLEKIKEK
jgi:hypothetical protein